MLQNVTKGPCGPCEHNPILPFLLDTETWPQAFPEPSCMGLHPRPPPSPSPTSRHVASEALNKGLTQGEDSADAG